MAYILYIDDYLEDEHPELDLSSYRSTQQYLTHLVGSSQAVLSFYRSLDARPDGGSPRRDGRWLSLRQAG